MSDLERQISRYLDGELAPAELETLRLTLSESSEARALLRELTAIRGAARGGAAIRRPSRRIESELFRRLRTEGLYAESGGHRKAPIQNTTGSVPVAADRRRRIAAGWSTVAAALSLLLVIGTGYLLNQKSTQPASVVNRATAPYMIHANFGDVVAVPPVRLVAAVQHGKAESITDLRESQLTRVAMITQPSIPVKPDSSGAISAPAMAFVVPDHRPAQSESNRTVLLPPMLPNRESGEPSLLAASFRPRAAYINTGDGAVTEEMSLRLDARLGEGHHVAFIVGSSASVAETHHQNTGIYISRTVKVNPDGSPDAESSPMLVSVKPYQMEVQKEVWVGFGYNYSFALPLKNVQVGGGVTAGTSAGSWRLGLELPVTLRVSKGMAVEVAASATHIMPRDRSVSEFIIDNSSDGLLYQGETMHPAFTSYGLEVGVSIDLP